MVDSLGPAGANAPPTRVRDSLAAAETGFSIGRDAVRGAPVPTSLSVGSPIGLETMLALQAVDEDRERDRGARKRGSALIAALSDLQRAMLADGDPALALQALGSLAADCPEAAEPALGAAVRAIVLRARVEVARRARGEVARRARDEVARRAREAE